MERSALLAQLDATAHPHCGKAATAWLSLLASTARLTDYRAQLAVTYGFEGPIESALTYTKDLGTLVHLRARLRSGLAAQDLLALGYTPSDITALPQCSSITSFDDIAEALGWLYVVERTAFHHETVRRNLIQRLPGARTATSYLAASGATAAVRWHALGQALEEYAFTDEIAERVIGAAAHAYRQLHEWNKTNQRRLRSAG